MKKNEISESTLCKLRDGDLKAFEKIYHSYYVYLCSIATYYVHNRQVANEIVNDVFVSLWQKPTKIYYPVLPYLRRAVQNGSISYLRSSFLENEIMDKSTYSFLEQHVTSFDNPLDALEESEIKEIILQKVEELPDRCKAIFKACTYEGKSYVEVSKELGINVTTVRVQMKIAFDKLREKLPSSLILLLIALYLKK